MENRQFSPIWGYLAKNEIIEINFKKIAVGFGWDSGDGRQDLNLDASAFLLDDKGKLVSPANLVFYNNLTSFDKSVVHHPDMLTEYLYYSDDDIIFIDLEQSSLNITSILFVITIYDFESQKLNFGQVKDLYARIITRDDDDKEIVIYHVKESFSTESAIEIGRLYRHNDKWFFEALNEAVQGGLQSLVDKYS